MPDLFLVLALLVAIGLAGVSLPVAWPLVQARVSAAPVAQVLLASPLRRWRLFVTIQPQINRLHGGASFPAGARLLIVDGLPRGAPWDIAPGPPPIVYLAARGASGRLTLDELLAVLAVCAFPAAAGTAQARAREEWSLPVAPAGPIPGERRQGEGSRGTAGEGPAQARPARESTRETRAMARSAREAAPHPGVTTKPPEAIPSPPPEGRARRPWQRSGRESGPGERLRDPPGTGDGASRLDDLDLAT